MLAHNVETARNFAALSDAEKDHLRKQLDQSRQGLEKKLVGHLDGPTACPEMFAV